MTCRLDGCEEPRYATYAVCRPHHNERRRAKYNGDPTGKDRTLRFKYGIICLSASQRIPRSITPGWRDAFSVLRTV